MPLAALCDLAESDRHVYSHFSLQNNLIDLRFTPIG